MKSVWVLTIVLAFVAGSILTGAMAYASGDKKGQPFEALWDAIHALETAISLDDDADSSNEDQTLSGTGEVVLGTTAAGDGGGTVTCADITGDASLCDGDDAVVDNDNDSSNELQTISETSNGVISLSNGGGSVTVQDRVSGFCAAGSSIRVIAANGAVTCETDNGSDLKYERVSTSHTAKGLEVSPFSIDCPAGKVVVGGGFSGLNAFTIVKDSYASDDNTWKVTVDNGVIFNDDITIYAVCIDNSP